MVQRYSVTSSTTSNRPRPSRPPSSMREWSYRIEPKYLSHPKNWHLDNNTLVTKFEQQTKPTRQPDFTARPARPRALPLRVTVAQHLVDDAAAALTATSCCCTNSFSSSTPKGPRLLHNISSSFSTLSTRHPHDVDAHASTTRFSINPMQPQTTREQH